MSINTTISPDRGIVQEHTNEVTDGEKVYNIYDMNAKYRMFFRKNMFKRF